MSTSTASRRTVLRGALAGLGAAVAAGCAAAPATSPATVPATTATRHPTATPPPAPATISPDEAAARFAAIEADFGGRLGVCALDTGTGATVGHRADERFLLCSTGKAPTAAAILRADQQRPGLLDTLVRYGPDALIRNSPTTTARLGTGMTVAELCEAAITVSDNAAQNLLLAQLGGPAAVTAFVRSVGDTTTRFDRTEPALNARGGPSGAWDTTTPRAIVGTLRACALGDALDPARRDRLVAWLVGNTTGDQRIRAGLPAGWRTGDKTGSGDRNEVNDVAVTWPPGRAPLVIAVYTEPADPDSEANVPAVPAAAAVTVAALHGSS